MLKALGTYRAFRPVVANLASTLSSSVNKVNNKIVLQKEFHTTPKKLGGGDAEFIVRFLRLLF